MNKRLRILVTGAHGQLGHSLRMMAGAYPQLEFHFFSRAELSIADEENVNKVFLALKPDWCINTAAYTLVDKAETDQESAFMINGVAVGYLAKASRSVGAKFIHISTDYVFAGNHSAPYLPDDPIDPLNIYGASKAEGEKRALQFQPDSYIIRTSWLYGKEGNNFVKTMQRLMNERDQIGVVCDQQGSPTNADDLAMAIIHLILKGQNVQPGIYHFSNSGVTTWHGFASAIKEIMGSQCIINAVPTSAYPTPAKRPAYSVMDTTKIKLALDMDIPEWRDSLERYLKA